MDSTKRVLLTGGHAGTTALAVIEEIRKREETKNWRLFWIGAKRAIEGKNLPTIESQILPKFGVTCFSITMGRLQRRFSRYTIPSYLKIPIGFFHAFLLLSKIKPDVVLAFGGFAAFPVVVVSWVMRIPVIIHEQTAAAGRSNLASSYFATKIALSRESSREFYPKDKTIMTGNPVTEKIRSIPPKKKMENPPVLFITGGSRGSQPLNMLVEALLDQLVKDFMVIHQTGTLDIDYFEKRMEKLPPHAKNRYELTATIDPMLMYKYWERADIVLARSGANTTSEALMTKRPSLFIPLPFAHNDEQTKNARFNKEFGLSDYIAQDNSDPQTLYAKLLEIKQNWYEIIQKVSKKESPDRDGAKNVVDVLRKYV